MLCSWSVELELSPNALLAGTKTRPSNLICPRRVYHLTNKYRISSSLVLSPAVNSGRSRAVLQLTLALGSCRHQSSTLEHTAVTRLAKMSISAFSTWESFVYAPTMDHHAAVGVVVDWPYIGS